MFTFLYSLHTGNFWGLRWRTVKDPSTFTNGKFCHSAWQQPPGFLPSCCPSDSFPSHLEYVYVPIHRRHLPCPDLQGISYFGSQHHRSSPSSTGICPQSNQILSCPFWGDVTSRFLDRHLQRPGKAILGQDPGNNPGISGSLIPGERISSMPPDHCRAPGFLSCYSPSMSLQTKTDFNAPVQEFQEEIGFHFQGHSSGRAGGSGGSLVLGRPLSGSRGSPPGLPTSEANTNHGHLQSRLGSSPGWETRCGNLDSGRVSEPCQHTRDFGGSQGTPVLPREPSTRSSPRSDGQDHRPFLSEQEMGRGGGGGACRGARETGGISGVVARSRSSQPSLSCVGEPMGRPFHNKRERESSSLLQPDFGTRGLSRWCPTGWLVQGSPIHVPTHSSASPVTSQDQARRSRRDCHPTFYGRGGVGSLWYWVFWSICLSFCQLDQVCKGVHKDFLPQGLRTLRQAA